MKKTILTVIITAVICITGTVYAVSAITANQVTYTDRNNTATNVKNALDGLYDNLDSRIIMNTFGTAQYASYNGDANAATSKSINLQKGKYILLLTYEHTWVGGDYSNTVVENPGYSDFAFNYNSSNCTVTNLSGYYNRLKPSNNNNYLVNYNKVYLIDITSQSENISISIPTNPTSNAHGEFLGIQAIPIN